MKTEGCIESVVTFDVDETLILWSRSGKTDVEFICPHYGNIEAGHKHKEHVQRVKDHYKLGHFVIIWSAGGGEYARRATEALGLLEHSHLQISKPMQYYDDIDAHSFMGRRTFLGQVGMKGGDMYIPRTDMILDMEDK